MKIGVSVIDYTARLDALERRLKTEQASEDAATARARPRSRKDKLIERTLPGDSAPYPHWVVFLR